MTVNMYTHDEVTDSSARQRCWENWENRPSPVWQAVLVEAATSQLDAPHVLLSPAAAPVILPSYTPEQQRPHTYWLNPGPQMMNTVPLGLLKSMSVLLVEVVVVDVSVLVCVFVCVCVCMSLCLCVFFCVCVCSSLLFLFSSSLLCFWVFCWFWDVCLDTSARACPTVLSSCRKL